eukprot:GHVP01050990.1.p1 GENE.GHVP01050990.1~~GHVP01050990.1.p1  ORF type:complete len:170 (-),score=12.16 GHVP01050990.1:403-912(-)
MLCCGRTFSSFFIKLVDSCVRAFDKFKRSLAIFVNFAFRSVRVVLRIFKITERSLAAVLKSPENQLDFVDEAFSFFSQPSSQQVGKSLFFPLKFKFKTFIFSGLAYGGQTTKNRPLPTKYDCSSKIKLRHLSFLFKKCWKLSFGLQLFVFQPRKYQSQCCYESVPDPVH